MRRRRYTKEQIITILKEHQAGLSADELCENPAKIRWPSNSWIPAPAVGEGLGNGDFGEG